MCWKAGDFDLVVMEIAVLDISGSYYGGMLIVYCGRQPQIVS